MISDLLQENYDITACKTSVCKIMNNNEFRYGKINIIHNLSDDNKNKRILFGRKMLR